MAQRIIIENKEWEKRINIIRQEKKKILTMYSFFPRLEGLILFDRLSKIVISPVTVLQFKLKASP